jgi:hypothetical protein
MKRLVTLALSACLLVLLGDLGLASLPPGTNGRSLTGTKLGYHGTGPRELAYVDLDTWRLAGAPEGGSPAVRVDLVGTHFYLLLPDGKRGAKLTHAELARAEMRGCTVHDERLVLLRIRDVASVDGDIDVYKMEYHLAPHGVSCADKQWEPADKDNDGHWFPLCPDPDATCQVGGRANRDAGGNEGAFPVDGVWNFGEGDAYGKHQYAGQARRISVSCRWGAIGKCVYQRRAGYDWKNLIVDEKTDKRHQACVRAMRADYCGNGRSHTFDGTQLHVSKPMEDPTEGGDSYKMEAYWNEAGAICLSDPRYDVDPTDPSEKTADFIAHTCPRLASKRCDRAAPDKGALVGTEVVPLKDVESADEE